MLETLLKNVLHALKTMSFFLRKKVKANDLQGKLEQKKECVHETKSESGQET